MKLSCIILLLVPLIGLSQVQKEIEPNQDRSNRVLPGISSIKVSEDLYDATVEWLSTKTEQTLWDYLRNNNKSKEIEISNFEKRYKSGINKNSASDCNCKTIIPSTFHKKSSPINLPWDKVVSEHPFLSFINLNEYSVWREVISDGLGINHQHKAASDGVIKPRSHTLTSNGSSTIRMLNLCTVQGQRSDLCNCDKVI